MPADPARVSHSARGISEGKESQTRPPIFTFPGLCLCGPSSRRRLKCLTSTQTSELSICVFCPFLSVPSVRLSRPSRSFTPPCSTCCPSSAGGRGSPSPSSRHPNWMGPHYMVALYCSKLAVLLENKVKQEKNENKIQDTGYLRRGQGRGMSLGGPHRGFRDTGNFIFF